MAEQSSIVWQNHDATVTLLDIPHSIAQAQASKDAPFPYRLLSSPPVSAPFATNEPKSAKARSKLAVSDDVAQLQKRHQYVLQRALDQVRAEHSGPWYLPRPFVEELPSHRKRRRMSNDAAPDPLSSSPNDSSTKPTLAPDLLSNLARGENKMALITETPSQDSIKTDHNAFNGYFFTNSQIYSPAIKISSSTNPNIHTFHVPPNSSFHLSDCTNSTSFHSALSHHSKESTAFDFLLLDPPWPNRSVRRTHKTPGSSYFTSYSPTSTQEMLLDMNLDLLMADECYVGIWITNKPAIREIVLGDDGLFASWDVELVEEWLWLKITAAGDPVVPIDSAWRKPYEILLLGRKRTPLQNGNTISLAAQAEVKRRVILGVPDLHSRKPCLKELIEPLMRDRESYRALEVFARHLVAGWCSWGDECIKFNWEGYWQDIDEKEESSDKTHIAHKVP